VATCTSKYRLLALSFPLCRLISECSHFLYQFADLVQAIVRVVKYARWRSTMADQNLHHTPSDDEKYIADEKHISTPSSINGHRTPEAVAAEYGLSEKKLLRKLDLYLVPGVAVSSTKI
jgi:hypothetical protein